MRLQTQILHSSEGIVLYRGTAHALREIVRAEGVLALWKGLGASLLGTSDHFCVFVLALVAFRGHGQRVSVSCAVPVGVGVCMGSVCVGVCGRRFVGICETVHRAVGVCGRRLFVGCMTV